MFRIKICGVTRGADAQAAVYAGADAIGLNFYEKSSRCVTPSVAREIASVLPQVVASVGVFVNASVEQINTTIEASHLSAAQLHGDEPPEIVAALLGVRVVRTRRLDQQGVVALAKDLAACHAAGRKPSVVLVDAAAPGAYGGTGQTVSWPDLADYHEHLGPIPLILAGGLTPDNVADAIRTVRPYGVDVASGVESSPGVKDPAKVRDFVQAAREALASLG